MMQLFYSTLLFLLALAPNLQAQQGSVKSIFNGKDLQGWDVPQHNPWWTVNKGILTGQHDAQKQGSILWTERSFGNFVLEADFKMGGGIVDSGIFLRDEDLQVQIGVSSSLKRDMTGSPYIPGKGYPQEAQGVAQLLKPKGWNTLKIQLVGKDLNVWLNGHHVLQYAVEKVPPRGPIGIQVHQGNEMTVMFRKLEVAEL